MNKHLYFRAGNVFTPNSPVRDSHLFSGRKEQIKSLLRAVSGKGSHAIIFGERGVGKTSLGHVALSYLPPDSGMIFAAVSCESGLPYSTLWYSIFERMSVTLPATRRTMGFSSGSEQATRDINFASLVRDPERITSQDVRAILEASPVPVVILIDEVDRLNKETTRTLADTIKSLSDYNVNATLVLIGVADSIGQLIEGHQSVERALVQIQMPRMTSQEVDGIITSGVAELGIGIEPEARRKVVSLSRGLPHYTHLLMLHAAQSSAEHDSQLIEDADFDIALALAVQEKGRSLTDKYLLAIQSTKKAYLFPYVLLACALARTDTEGYFSMTDILVPMKSLIGDETLTMASFIKHVGEFCTEERGAILERRGKEKKWRYRFSDPLMPSFVIMKAMSEKLKSSTPLEHLI